MKRNIFSWSSAIARLLIVSTNDGPVSKEKTLVIMTTVSKHFYITAVNNSRCFAIFLPPHRALYDKKMQMYQSQV